LIHILDCFNSVEACERSSQEAQYFLVIKNAPMLLAHSRYYSKCFNSAGTFPKEVRKEVLRTAFAGINAVNALQYYLPAYPD